MNKLILFDIDGTLTSAAVGHIEAHAVAYQKVFGLYGSIYMVDYNGATDKQITKSVLSKLGVDDATIEAKINEHMRVMEEYYSSLKPYLHPKLLPGVTELLGALSSNENVLLGNVTGNLPGIAHAKLEIVGISECFKLGGFGDESYDRADLVRNAIEKARAMGFEGDDVYVIGDTPSDITAGNAGGAKTVGVATGSYDEQSLAAAGASVTIADLSDIQTIYRVFGLES